MHIRIIRFHTMQTNVLVVHSPAQPEPAASSESYFAGADDADANGGYAAPLETFSCVSRRWAVYATDEGHVYYLTLQDDDSAEEVHSQWWDPREYGLVYEDHQGEGVSIDVAEDYSADNQAHQECDQDFDVRAQSPQTQLKQTHSKHNSPGPSPHRPPYQMRASPTRPPSTSLNTSSSPSTVPTSSEAQRTARATSNTRPVARALAWEIEELEPSYEKHTSKYQEQESTPDTCATSNSAHSSTSQQQKRRNNDEKVGGEQVASSAYRYTNMKGVLVRVDFCVCPCAPHVLVVAS